MARSARLLLRPIGRVRGADIVLHQRWARALDGLEGFSHLVVLFWLDRARPPARLRIHPRGLADLPEVGLLATRTPHRPNPIGMTVVRLLSRRGAVLRVEGLDAWEGTPVLDLKPYTRKDAVGKSRMPGWVRALDRAEKDPLRRYAQR